jgi:hypothetical protein
VISCAEVANFRFVTRRRVLAVAAMAIAGMWAVQLIVILLLNTVTLHGTVTVVNDGPSKNPCSSVDHRGIHTGTPMILRGISGKTIGFTQLRIGRPSQHGLQCVYSFTFRNVPPGAKVYFIEVGRDAQIRATPSQFIRGLQVTLD